MPNGKPHDHPFTDLFAHHMHPFPPDVEALVRELSALSPGTLSKFDREAFDWEAGRNLEAARTKLRSAIEQERSKQSP